MTEKTYIYIFIMAAVTFLIRALPMTLIRSKIKNRFIKSFLYYVPYVTLAVMTFPAVIYATQSVVSGVAALIVGLIAAWRGLGLFKVAVSCCLVVFVTELLMGLLNVI